MKIIRTQTITKILITIFVMLVLSVTTSIIVFATDDATAYVTSDTSVYREEEITFTVGINNASAVQSILIIPEYDKQAFELVDGAWTLSTDSLIDFNVSSGDAVILFNPSKSF